MSRQFVGSLRQNLAEIHSLRECVGEQKKLWRWPSFPGLDEDPTGPTAMKTGRTTSAHDRLLLLQCRDSWEEKGGCTKVR